METQGIFDANKKPFNGKIIRYPNGKAGEYSYIAADAWFGCSNDCTYCYLKKGVWKHLFTNPPHLKRGIRDNDHAFELFKNDVEKIGITTLKKYGIFLNFESDPFLSETSWLTQKIVSFCAENKITVKLLTKRANVFYDPDWKDYVAFGFTLTGHDELEPNASTNSERIASMKKLHDAGFKTWASIEPVIDFKSTMNMVAHTYDICDLYKVGLLSGKNTLGVVDCKRLINNIIFMANQTYAKIYFKDSLLKSAGINREDLPNNCVGRDYDMFNK